MTTQLGDTLTTREAIRRATADDIVGRCEIAAQTIEGGPLDGVLVVSMGTLRDQVIASLLVELPPPSDKYAEVITPAIVSVSAVCPECKEPAEIAVTLRPRLTVEGGVTEIAVKAKSKPTIHMHGQLALPSADTDQVGMDGVIEDLRLRILGAVYDLEVEHDAVDGSEPGPKPTLDVIARRLELASESDRGDLEESLYSYSQLEEPFVEVLSVKGEPVVYGLTDAGVDLVDDAREPTVGETSEPETGDDTASDDSEPDGSAG